MTELYAEEWKVLNSGNQWGEPTPEEEAAWKFLEQRIKNQASFVQSQDQK